MFMGKPGKQHVTTVMLFGWLIALCSLVMAPAAPAHAAGAAVATLVRAVDTSQWSPPSPDPSGITYWPAHNTLLVSDGEVDEIANLFTGDNLFETTTTGSLVDTYSTIPFSREPAGIEIEVNPANGHLFIGDDDQDRVYEISLGADGQYGTGDDVLRSFSTAAFGDTDPEGLALGQGKLYLTGGPQNKVYQLDPGPNGVFEGAGDDRVATFDTLGIGVRNPEGIEFNPATSTLYIISTKRDMVEATTSGTLVRTIDLSRLNAVAPADVTLAPSSQNASVQHLYIVDRGLDNNTSPGENDGKIFEVTLEDVLLPNNLLANPSFETDANGDSRPDTWTSNSAFTRSTETVPIDSTFIGKFRATNNSSVTIKQTVTSLTAGTTYTFSCWAKLIPTPGDSFTYKFQVQWRDAHNSTIRTDTVKAYTNLSPQNVWDQAAKSLVAPTGTTKAQILLKAGSLNGTIYVDACNFGR